MFYTIIKYWLKIIRCQNTKYVKIVNNMLVNDFNVYPNKVSWAKLLHNLLYELGLMESKNINNDQELIQSDPTSCPINQKGNN